MNKREIYLKRQDELKQWTDLRNCLIRQQLNFTKARVLMKLESEHYKKWLFLLNLGKAMKNELVQGTIQEELKENRTR